MSIITITPVVSEKAYAQSIKNVYVFNVPLDANKDQIAQAVEAEHEGVKVARVSTVVRKGKAIRYSRGKRAYPGTTHRKDTKKAYVTLAEGSINVFGVAEQEETK